MKNNKQTTFIIVASVLILIVFTSVATYNLIPKNKESDSYYVKVNDNMDAKIEGMEIDDNVLLIKTSGDALKYCVKSTVSTPKENSLCWKEIENNEASISIYHDKKYYVWIMDSKKEISSPLSINTRD